MGPHSVEKTRQHVIYNSRLSNIVGSEFNHEQSAASSQGWLCCSVCVCQRLSPQRRFPCGASCPFLGSAPLTQLVCPATRVWSGRDDHELSIPCQVSKRVDLSCWPTIFRIISLYIRTKKDTQRDLKVLHARGVLPHDTFVRPCPFLHQIQQGTVWSDKSVTATSVCLRVSFPPLPYRSAQVRQRRYFRVLNTQDVHHLPIHNYYPTSAELDKTSTFHRTRCD